jgi:mRNA interferase HigB
VRVISRRALVDHWSRPGREDSEGPLRAWFKEAEKASWRSPAEIKASYGSASFVSDRVVFNVGGNKYRLVVRVKYEAGIVFVRFVGTHVEYDAIDVAEV